MKKRLGIFLLSVLFCSSLFAANNNTLNYAIGYRFGQSLKTQGFTLQTDAFIQGIKSGFKGTTPIYSKKKMQAALRKFQQEAMEHILKERKAQAKDNLTAGKTFLAKNKQAPDVITLKSGLQYKIVKEGKGPKPKASDTVVVNYIGKLLNGKIFDSSFKRGVPATFQVNQVVPGWTEALELMPVGSTWILYIPAKLAYGARGAGNVIPPNSTLVFKVHLVKIK